MRAVEGIEREQMDAAVTAITSAIGTPRRMEFPNEIVVAALAELTGRMHRMTLRTAEEALPLIRDGWSQVPDHLRAIFGSPRRLEELNPRVVAAVVQTVLRSMSQSKIPIPSHIACSALANLVGQVARMADRSPDDVFLRVQHGWSAVTQEEVDAAQMAMGNRSSN
jgi:hypothetical protein